MKPFTVIMQQGWMGEGPDPEHPEFVIVHVEARDARAAEILAHVKQARDGNPSGMEWIVLFVFAGHLVNVGSK